MTTTGRTPLPPGTRIGRFELVTELDRDEVSAVWAARILGQRTTARAARVQVLEPRVAADLELRTLFLREARAATKIKHPAFAPVLDAGPHGSGGAHLATAYFDAASLSELLQAASDRNVRLPTDVALRIVCEVLDPLAEMHAVRLETAGSTRLLHGDLRPDAILVTLEGVSRLVPSCAGAAACRQPLASVVKRLAYKAPEQIRHEGIGASIDARADQFALGAILWEVFAGRRPFSADEAGQLVRAVLTDPVESIATVAPDIEPRIAKIVDRLLSRDPEARYYDVEELSTELNRAAGPLLADRSRVALAVRELMGPRIEQRREFIRRRCANDELERAAETASEVASPGSAAAGPVGRVVQVPSGSTVPWARPPPPPRRTQASQPDAASTAQPPLPARPPPVPARLPAVEDLDPPTQRTGSTRALKAAAPVGQSGRRPATAHEAVGKSVSIRAVSRGCRITSSAARAPALEEADRGHRCARRERGARRARYRRRDQLGTVACRGPCRSRGRRRRRRGPDNATSAYSAAPRCCAAGRHAGRRRCGFGCGGRPAARTRSQPDSADPSPRATRRALTTLTKLALLGLVGVAVFANHIWDRRAESARRSAACRRSADDGASTTFRSSNGAADSHGTPTERRHFRGTADCDSAVAQVGTTADRCTGAGSGSGACARARSAIGEEPERGQVDGSRRAKTQSSDRAATGRGGPNRGGAGRQTGTQAEADRRSHARRYLSTAPRSRLWPSRPIAEQQSSRISSEIWIVGSHSPGAAGRCARTDAVRPFAPSPL